MNPPSCVYMCACVCACVHACMLACMLVSVVMEYHTDIPPLYRYSYVLGMNAHRPLYQWKIINLMQFIWILLCGHAATYFVYRFTLMKSTWTNTPAKWSSFEESVIAFEQSTKILLKVYKIIDVMYARGANVACSVCLFQSFIY